MPPNPTPAAVISANNENFLESRVAARSLNAAQPDSRRRNLGEKREFPQVGRATGRGAELPFTVYQGVSFHHWGNVMLAVDERARSALQTTDRIRYRIASTQDEREAAFRLVYTSYLEAGLSVSNPHLMRISPHQLAPTTQVFVAVLDDQVIFTASLVADGALGLPLESIFPEEVAQRRERGIQLAEVSCLADRRSQFRSSFPVFLKLSRLMLQYARRQQIDQLLVATHPRHARFYRRMLNFEPFGEQRDYPMVQNSPAVPLVLDFDLFEQVHPENYATFFGEQLPDQLLRPRPITPEQRDYFSQFVDTSYRCELELDAEPSLHPCYP